MNFLERTATITVTKISPMTDSKVIKILNDEARAVNLAVYVQGELKDYVKNTFSWDKTAETWCKLFDN